MSAFNFGNSRFGSDIAAGLHELNMIGLHDDIGGTVDQGFSYSLFIIDQPFSTEVEENGFEIDIPAGNYILSYDGQGFIDVEIFETPESARETFDAYVAEQEDLAELEDCCSPRLGVEDA